MKNDLNAGRESRTPTKNNSDGDDVKDVVDRKDEDTNIEDSIATDKNLNTSTYKKVTDTTEEKLTTKTHEEPKDDVTDFKDNSSVAEQHIDNGRLVVVVCSSVFR